MKDPLRALRRHHVARLKKKRQKYWGRKLNDPASLGKVAATPCPCSCWMCGNPRKNLNQPTLEERRDAQNDYDEPV